MTKEVKTLSEKEVDALVKAYIEYKAAEARFKLLKDTLTDKIEPGKYVGKHGYINKSVSTRCNIDYKKLIEDHQDIDLQSYTTEKEVTMITVTNLTPESNLLRHLF